MAKIPESSGSGLADMGPPPPAGTYLAVCVDVLDLYGVDRKKYQSEEMEKVDVTRFVFGVKTKAGALHKIATKEMKISGGPKANLTKFIRAWTGEAPKAGWDTEMLKGKGTNFAWKLQELGTFHKDLQNIAKVRACCDSATAFYKRTLAGKLWDKITLENSGEFKMEEVRVLLASITRPSMEE